MPEYPWDLEPTAADDSDLIDEDPVDEPDDLTAEQLDQVLDACGREAKMQERACTLELLRETYQATRAGVLVDVMRKLERGEHR